METAKPLDALGAAVNFLHDSLHAVEPHVVEFVTSGIRKMPLAVKVIVELLFRPSLKSECASLKPKKMVTAFSIHSPASAIRVASGTTGSGRLEAGVQESC
jgi:hypothetical protein